LKLNENTEVTAAEAVQADPQTLPVPPETPETALVETAPHSIPSAFRKKS